MESQELSGHQDVAEALRALPWQTVARIGRNTEDRDGFEPVVDGVGVIGDTQTIFDQGRQHAVPFIAGYNSFEGNLTAVLPWTDQPPRAELEKRIDRLALAPLYGRRPDDEAVWDDLYGDVFFGASALRLVRKMERTKAPAWTYYFDYVRGRGPNSRGAGHGSEVPFVFDRVVLPGAKGRTIVRAIQGHLGVSGDLGVVGSTQTNIANIDRLVAKPLNGSRRRPGRVCVQ